MKQIDTLIIAVLAIFAPIQMIIVTTGVLVFADLITGIIAAKKRGESINSGGLRRTTTKTLVYLTSICIGYLVEKYMLNDFIAISKIITGLIAATELKSILENMDSINGSSVFKAAIQKLGSINDKVQEDVKSQLNDKKED